MRNRVYIQVSKKKIFFFNKNVDWAQILDDIVLISLRSFQDDRSDIVLKYFPEEVKQLQAMGELPYELEL